MYSTSRLDKTLRGVAYVALGVNAQREVKLSRKTLPKDLAVRVFEDESGTGTTDQKAHLAKTRVFSWSPFEHTLLLDADTRVKGDISVGFSLLNAGWDLVMVPSEPPKPDQVLWHLSSKERDYTFEELGTWHHIMLNTGVMFFSKNTRTERLFGEWEREWTRFRDRDQGAFLRALKRCPVYLWILGTAYNSRTGEVIEHLFGRAR